MRDQILVALLTMSVALGVAACGSDDSSSTVTQHATAPPATTPAAPAAAPPVAGAPGVVLIDLGRSLNPDNTMHDGTVLFLATNEVWASVIVEGTAPKATLQARWVTEGGEVVATSTQEIIPKRRTLVGFHAAPSGGWKLGHYRVEILLDDVAAGSKGFEVKEPPL
jgi:hypothetical protein